MARLVKIFLIGIAAIIGVGVVASIVVFLFYDTNNLRDDIAQAAKKATGRELVIDGDLSLSVFPWIAVELGSTRLGNAEGFGDEPAASFEEARLSVRLIPLIFSQRVAVGTAELTGLRLNFVVNEAGISNMEGIGEQGEDAAAAADSGEITATTTAPTSADAPADINIGGIRVTDARITYRDERAGTSATVSNLNFETGEIEAGQSFDVDAGFAFDSQPADMGGELAMRGEFLFSDDLSTIDISGLNISGTLTGATEQPTDFNFDSRAISVDTAAERVALGEMDLGVMGISMTATVEPFSYAGDPQPVMALRVNEFSLIDLMQSLAMEAPATADPNALQRVSFEGRAAVLANEVALSELQLQLDDTTMTGSLSLPKEASGKLRFDLNVDSIVVDNYMAPGDPDAGEEEVAGSMNTEIPAELIRSLNASGSFSLQQAMLSGITFENMELGLNAENGKLRMHPITADMFDGRYNGDVRIDASGDEPVLSVNENIEGVQLESLAKAMYDVNNINGTIDGSFVLSGRGADTDTLVKNLSGNVSFALMDGEWLGTDVWYQLRRARAALKQETPPEPRVPVRTEFSSVTVSGAVANGILESNDLLAELPFLRLTGRGKANFVDATVDYRMDARVVEKPEFAGQATEAEIKDFTSLVVPIIVSGPLTAPKIQPDIEGLAKQQIKKETDRLRDRLIDKLLKSRDKDSDNPDGDG